MPFGFHLAMDTLPSGELQVLGFRSALACVRLSLSCPFKLLHTFHLPRPTRHYPRLRIQRSSFERRRDFNPPEQRAAQRTSGRRWRACTLATVRRSNCTCSFPAYSFHEDSRFRDASKESTESNSPARTLRTTWFPATVSSRRSANA